jgi:hypothetical protein
MVWDVSRGPTAALKPGVILRLPGEGSRRTSTINACYNVTRGSLAWPASLSYFA